MAGTITEKTRLPISIVVGIVAVACGVVGSNLKTQHDVADLKRLVAENLSREDFKDWARQLEKSNPHYLQVPDLPPSSRKIVRNQPPVMGSARVSP